MKIARIMWKILKVFFTVLGGYVALSNIAIICVWAKRHGLKNSLKHWKNDVMATAGEVRDW